MTRQFIHEALNVEAHPLWGRIAWRLLKSYDLLDEKELESAGVQKSDLWWNGDDGRFTYGKWFTLIQHTYNVLGPNAGVYLADAAHQTLPVYVETVQATAPNLRAFFYFWEHYGSDLDLSHSFTSRNISGGVSYSVDYSMSGIFEQAFSLSCMMLILNAVQNCYGNRLPLKITVNFDISDFVMQAAEEVLGAKLCRAKDRHAPSFAFQVTNEVLDEPSVGSDEPRFLQAIEEFKALCQAMRDSMARPSLADIVVSHQITSNKVISMEQMAERVDMKVENYRKKLRECGTSHRALVKECVNYNAEKMISIGMSQADICRKMGMSQARLRRYLNS